ncbi:DUF2806 domain-containing protein [Pseudodesulfovibrio tunisiensis]|uniref:DUF2806 domain-containing protein n=1 Tax=Pseudodesulfovibrio tunisiensis TaxID=463192 RepID=UPI001FB332EB|nr:DUF2806 domain-containing protein [Pseudodesulfovibrio tunisiensis]
MTEELSPVKVDVKLDATESANTVTQGLRKGVAKLFNAMMGKRLANVEYFQKLTAAQAEKDCLAIASGQAEFRDQELIHTNSLPPIRNQVLQIEAEQEMRNLAENMREACVALADVPDEEISDKDIEPDFFARWRREAKVIGNEDLQRIWGKLLAEEVKRSSSISVRTLDVVKNLSRDEAELFCKLASYIVDGAFIVCPPRNSGVAYKNIYSEIAKMVECGIVVDSTGQAEYESNKNLLLTNKKVAVMHKYFVVNHDPNKKLVFIGAVLTRAGVDLYKIADFDPMLKSNFKDFYECINDNSTVKIHPVLQGGGA